MTDVNKPMRIGYIAKHQTDDPNRPTKFALKDAPYTRRISSHSDKIHCKIFMQPVDYEEVKANTDMLKQNTDIMLVTEPFFMDTDLQKRCQRWVDWANNTDPANYDPFA